jgi:hypothetical protein
MSTMPQLQAEAGRFSGATRDGVRWILRLEGLAAFLAAVLAYHLLDAGWIRFALLFFIPDLSMLGYLAGGRFGAAAYNAVHTYIGPGLLAGLGLWGGFTTALPVAAIWVAHIGFDRILGYGLKYDRGFSFTHLGLIGKARAGA